MKARPAFDGDWVNAEVVRPAISWRVDIIFPGDAHSDWIVWAALNTTLREMNREGFISIHDPADCRWVWRRAKPMPKSWKGRGR